MRCVIARYPFDLSKAEVEKSMEKVRPEPVTDASFASVTIGGRPYPVKQVGAVITGLLWRGAYQGFAWWVRDMSRFSIHGSIGTVVAFLFWIYISAVILLYGVEFTAAYGRLRRRRPEQIPAAPSPRV